MRIRLAPLAERVRGSYWFIPSLMTLAAIGLAVTLVRIDSSLGDLPTGLGWVYAGGPEGARSLLSAVAGSMITVVSVTFSVTVVALTVSSQHFGPRLLNSFMRDTAAQIVLGVFIATFAYCVVVLRTVRGSSEDIAMFVPHLAVTAGVALTLVSVAMLIFYVHHVSSSLQVTEIVRGVARDLESAIERLYPARIGGSDAAQEPPPVPDGAIPVESPESGYVQRVEAAGLLAAASKGNGVVWVVVRPGVFVGRGEPLALTTARDQARQIADTFVVGHDRTPDQDAGFAIQQLVEVALHALSPGINEPFTAVTCIDWLGQGLATLAARSMPAPCRLDRAGVVRVVAAPRSFAELLDDAFMPLREPAAAVTPIAEHLLRTLARIARACTDDNQRSAVWREADAVFGAAERQASDPSRRPRLEAARRLLDEPA